MPRSTIGYNIHQFAQGTQRHWSQEEVRYLFDHLERLQPTVLLVLNNHDWALQAKRLLPDCHVIFRRFYDQHGLNEANMWLERDAQWHIDQFAHEAEGGLALNIWNEPIPPEHQVRQFAEKYADVMEAFGQRGIPIVGPNFAVGFPNENWMQALEPMWQAFDRWHTLHDYGIHEYGTHRGMLFFEPDSPFNVHPFRVGRQNHFVLPYLRQQGHIVPTMSFTEWGVDTPYDGTNHRGWRSTWDETRFFEELIAADRALRAQTPHIRGYCIFCYGNSGQRGTYTDWATFDVMDALVFHKMLEDHIHQEEGDQPIVINRDWTPATAEIRDGKYVNIRAEPSLESEKLGEIHPGDSLFYDPAAQAGVWWPVKTGDVTGYAHGDYFVPVVSTDASRRTYRFSITIDVESDDPNVARLMALHLTAKLRDEYRSLKHAGELVLHMPKVKDLEIELNPNPEEI